MEIHADRQGMPGARELSFTAPPRAVFQRSHPCRHVPFHMSSLLPQILSQILSLPILLPLQQAQQIPNLAQADASPVWASQTQSHFPGLLSPALSRVSPAALVPPHLSSGNLTCTQERESLGDSSVSGPCRAPRASSPVCPSIPLGGSAQLQGTGLVSSQSVLGTESKQSLNR